MWPMFVLRWSLLFIVSSYIFLYYSVSKSFNFSPSYCLIKEANVKICICSPCFSHLHQDKSSRLFLPKRGYPDQLVVVSGICWEYVEKLYSFLLVLIKLNENISINRYNFIQACLSSYLHILSIPLNLRNNMT